MQTYDLTFAGAEQIELNVPGKYFALLACNNAVTVRFFLGGKKLDLGEITNVLSGLECTLGNIDDLAPAFDRVQIVSSGVDTVTIGIGNGQSRYNRGGQSSVTVLNVSGPFAQSAPVVTNASAVLSAAKTRRFVMIQNKDPVGNVFVNLGGSAATVAAGLKIGPGGSLSLESWAPNTAIYAIGDIASNTGVVLVEG